MDRRRLCLAAACVSVAGFLPAPAAADKDDALNLAVGGYINHDANLFRLPDSVDPQVALGKPSRSDTVRASYIGPRIDKPYGQQRFQFDLTEWRYRHDNFSHLNFDALDYRSAWLWQLTPRLSGNLSAERKQALVPAADFRSFQRNIRNTTTRLSSLAWSVLGGWSLLAGASRVEQLSEVPFLAEADFRLTGPEAGVKYLARSGSSITVLQHSRRGEFVNRVIDPVGLIDRAFRENESEVKLHWLPSGHATLDGRLAWLERRHEHFAQRDFSGAAGELDYAWTLPGKVRLNAFAKREITPSLGPLSSYRVNNVLSFTPLWQTSEKTSVRFRIDRTTSDFLGPVVAPPGPLRKDIVRTAQLSADWAPLRSILLTASVQRLTRSSNDATADFKTIITSINAAWSF